MTFHARTTHPPESLADHVRWLRHHNEQCVAEANAYLAASGSGSHEILNHSRMFNFHRIRARYHANAIRVMQLRRES